MKQNKQILVMVLIFAMLCSLLPDTLINHVKAAETDKPAAWYQISAKINASWGGHIAGEITVTNNSNRTRENWQIAFQWQSQITSMWNGTYEQTGQRYLIRPMEYNKNLETNASVTIGFLAEGEDAELNHLAADDFFTESGASVTDAEEREKTTPKPQEKPTPDTSECPTHTETPMPDTGMTAGPAITSATDPAVTATVEPTSEPTVAPTEEPTASPTTGPTEEPTAEPTTGPTEEPTAEPTTGPTIEPTAAPTTGPTIEPTAAPTTGPTIEPSKEPDTTPGPEEIVQPDLYLTSGLVLQEDTTCGSLYLLGGSLDLNGYTLTIQKNFEIYTTGNSAFGSGTIRLGGDLIQYESAAADSLCLGNEVNLCLYGNDTQSIQLAHPVTSHLGCLDLSGSAGVYMPGEIHAYRFAGAGKGYYGNQLRLGICYFDLDSDIQIPGDLVLLGGTYKTCGYRVNVGGDLRIWEDPHTVSDSRSWLQVTENTVEVKGGVELSNGTIQIFDQAQLTVAEDTAVNRGTLELFGGIFQAGQDLNVAQDGAITQWGGTLVVHGTWETYSRVRGEEYHRGTIELYGDLIQHEEATHASVCLDNEVKFCLKGSRTQQIKLAHPESSRLGQIDLSGCLEACLPEEIHGYSLSGIRRLCLGNQLRLGICYFDLDSDIEIPGDLVLLGGTYKTCGYRVAVGGDLRIQEDPHTVSDSRSCLQAAENTVEVKGGLELSNGTIQIFDQAQLTVAEDTAVNRGTLELFGGTFQAGQALNVAQDGAITQWGGTLAVHGTWETYSRVQGEEYHRGTIELYGDLIQHEEATHASVCLDNEVKLCLKGTATQRIRLAHTDASRLGQIDLSGSAGVYFDTEEDFLNGDTFRGLEKLRNTDGISLEFHTISLEKNVTYPGDLECYGDLALHHHSLTVEGSLYMEGNVSDPGTLDIYEDYTAVRGSLNPGNGTVRIGGNLRLKEDASVTMREAGGKLVVEGNFKTTARAGSQYNAGTVELKGDLTQTVDCSDNSLAQNGTKFIFRGTEKQKVTLERNAQHTHFLSLDLTDSAGVTFTKGILSADHITGWNHIDNGYLVVAGSREILEQYERFQGTLTLIDTYLDCNGQIFRADGGIETNAAVLDIHEGTLMAGGDMCLTGNSILQMRHEKDQVVVKGDFETYSALCHSAMLTAGRFELHGDFQQAGDGASFAASGDHTMVFAGETRQAVHFRDRENSYFAHVIVTGAGYYTDDDLWTRTIGVGENILLGMKDGLEELTVESVAGLPLTTAIAFVAEASGIGSIIVVAITAYFTGMIIADVVKTAEGSDNLYDKARAFGKDLVLFVPNLLSIKEVPGAAGQLENLADTPENLAGAVKKFCNPDTLKQMMGYMKEMLTDESGHINLGGMFRPFRSAESGLAKAETAEEAVRYCQEFLEEEGLAYLLQKYREMDVSAVIRNMRSVLSAAEAKGGKLGLDDVKYVVKGIKYEIKQESINDFILGKSDLVPDIGFECFKDLKDFLGEPGEGNAWHHIVEQSQICKSGFSSDKVHNIKNLIALPHGKNSVHAKISGFYSSKPDFTNGLTVRQWLSGKSFDEQFNYGMNILKRYGEVVETNQGWKFIPFE